MTSISFTPLFSVKQILFPLIQGKASTLVLSYLGEDAETTQVMALRVLKDLMAVDFTCKELVQVARSHISLKELFKPSENPLPIDFKYKGYKLEKIQSTMGPFTSNRDQQSLMLTVSEAHARFMMSYNKKTQTCEVNLTFRGDLPVWIKVGNPACWLSAEKGVPTGKVMTKLLMDKLGLTKKNVKDIKSCSENAQTVVDVVHALLVQGQSMPKAFALAHTSQLNAELGQTLDARSVHLVSVKKSYPDSYCTMEDLLESSELTRVQKEAFRKQPKVVEIYQLTGVDLFQDNAKVLPNKHVRVPDLIDLVYRVTP